MMTDNPRLGIEAPVLPGTPGEFITILAHYYRAEIGRMAGWRDRIDRTTNWAITVSAALLSVSLSTPNAHHSVVVFAMLLVLLLLIIEARRYRFFDVYRNRVRRLERNYFALVFAHEPCTDDTWVRELAEDLQRPQFLVSLRQAMARRLRRNYCWMFLILLLAWLLKTTTTRPPEGAAVTRLVQSFGEWLNNTAIGPLPGWVTVSAVGLLYAWVAFASLRALPTEGELAYGDVHV